MSLIGWLSLGMIFSGQISVLEQLRWISLMTSRNIEWVARMMQKWSQKTTYYMLVHKGDFEAELADCKTMLSDCFMTFTVSISLFQRNASLTEFQTAAQIELLASAREDEIWAKIFNESRQNDSDIRAISTMMQAVCYVYK